ncbi:MAG: hypothetical protein IJH50_05920 [Kiritimatiellae bacterium]|nr:hypothetical protein [Kiritimatiellia bacterium]
MEVQDGILDGTHVRCPYCNEKTTYEVSASMTLCGEDASHDRSQRNKLSAGIGNRHNTTRQINNSEPYVGAADEPGFRIQCESAMPPPTGAGVRRIDKFERQKFAIAISLFILIAIGALAIYWWKSQYVLAPPDRGVAEVFSEDAERARLTAEENAERERKRKETDAERARQKAEADAEREKRARQKAEADAEREKRRLAREKELQEQRNKAETERENRERVEEVERKFKSAIFVFASDFSEDKSPIRKDGTFYAIGVEYISDKKIYEAMVEQGTIVAVRSFSPRGEPSDVDVGTFKGDVMKNRFLAMGEDGVAWILGTGKSSWTEKVSLSDEDITPAKRELGGLFSILSGWGCLPDLKYRLTLKPGKSGTYADRGSNISLGIIEYCASISSEKLRDAILKPMKNRREEAANIAPPKLKKFMPTVVFYDGDVIRKELKVTKVPRHFKHLGTKHYGTVKQTTYNQAEEQWKRLRAEAERQERRKEEVLQENAQIMREHETKVRAILGKGISGEQIEAEAQKYVLLIERSRSRLAK